MIVYFATPKCNIACLSIDCIVLSHFPSINRALVGWLKETCRRKKSQQQRQIYLHWAHPHHIQYIIVDQMRTLFTTRSQTGCSALKRIKNKIRRKISEKKSCSVAVQCCHQAECRAFDLEFIAVATAYIVQRDAIATANEKNNSINRTAKRIVRYSRQESELKSTVWKRKSIILNP